MAHASHQALGAAGTVALPEEICAGARELAALDFANCVSEEFCGESVRDILLPAGLGDIETVLPAVSLHSMGLGPRIERARLYATCGVEPHIDDMDGLSVCIVLHSDGFTFQQCGARRKLHAGDWFVFDDRLEHEVLDTEEATTLLVLTAPLLQVL